jgi:hypothetical protein
MSCVQPLRFNRDSAWMSQVWFDGLISMFVFDILQIPSECTHFHPSGYGLAPDPRQVSLPRRSLDQF